MDSEVPASKVCSKCSNILSLDNFGKELRGKFGRRSVCKSCRRLERFNRDYKKEYEVSKERVKKNAKMWAEKNPDKAKLNKRKSRLKKLHLSLEDYERLLRKGDYSCYICDTVPKYNLAIDHCHITGNVRGLLCIKCNSALGFFKDDILLVKKAYKYLWKAKSNEKKAQK